MHKEKHCGKIGMVAIILACMILSGCSDQDTTDTPASTVKPNPPDYSNPVDLIPIQLTGVSEFSAFPDPISASFDSTEPLDGVHIPGGYGGREWLTDKEFVLSMVMDFESSEEAAQKLAEAKPSEAVLIELGDEGYRAEQVLADGSPGFKLLMWRRGGFLVIVGGGVLDPSGTVPSDQALIGLSDSIDKAILEEAPGGTQLSVQYFSLLPQKVTSLLPSRSLLAFPPSMLTSSVLQAKRDATITAPIKRTNEDGTEVQNGEITLGFNIVRIPGNADATYEPLEIKVFIDKISLAEYDGDSSFLRDGEGDVFVAGGITVWSEVNKTPVANSLYFATAELADIESNAEKVLNHYLDTLKILRDKCTMLTVTYDLLIRDNDSWSDVSEIIIRVEEILLTGAPEDKKPLLETATTAKNLLKKGGQPTDDQKLSSPGEAFAYARKEWGHDLGEAHIEDPQNLCAAKCPDLTISELAAAQPIQTGNPVTITVIVTNQGDEKAEGSEVTLNIAGHSLKGSAKQLNPGESTSVTFTYTFRDSETYTVTATVDPSNAIPESNEGNNQKSIRVQVKTKLPDLTIPEIRIAPQEIHIGDQVTFRVAVKNEGKGKAEKFTVKLEIAAEMTTSPTELESDVMNLNAGESSYVYFTHTFLHKGSYEILATADPRNAVSESEENNNTKQLTVTVEPGSLPDLMVSYVKIYYSYRESGGEEELYLTEVDFTVKNIGNGDCLGNIKVRIWLDSPSNVIYEDIVYTSPLPSMQQFTETIAFYDGWLVDPDTTHNVGVFVDSLNTITESNENNNTLEITFPEGHSILFLGYNMCCSVRIDIQERQFIPKELLS